MSVYRRCGCRDGLGRSYGVLGEKPTPAQLDRACPQMVQDPKHGRWSYRLSAGFDPVTKRRRQVNGRAYDTRREAQQARNAAAAKLDQGKLPPPNRVILAAYLTTWLERRARTGVRGGRPLSDATLVNYRRYAALDIAPSSLGGMKLRDIRRRHVQAFVDALVEDGRGATTVRRIVATLQSALSSAVRDELLDDSPARHLELPAVDRDEFVPWEPAQVRTFLDVAATHRLGALYLVAITTGLRRGELVALTWAEVDLERQELRVRRHTTKTDAGARRVALDPATVNALHDWRTAQEREAARWGVAYEPSGRVFTHEDGRPLLGQYVTRLFDTLRDRAELPRITFHGLRHLQASLQLAAGTPLAVVSKRLGHSSIAVTVDIYGHLLQSTEHAAAAAGAALIPPSPAAAPETPAVNIQRAAVHALHTQGGENEEKAAPAASGNGL